MKISIVTAVYNAARTIESTLKSVRAQTYPELEHIVIDGGSTDGTLEVLERYRGNLAALVSERDRGIYDAMNKGLRLATGEIIGTLNADDYYASADVLRKVAEAMESSGADVAWGDLEYVEAGDTARIVRRWRSSPYRPGAFRHGWMPPHPTFFVRRSVYERYGLFREDMKIGADYELMLRVLERHRVRGVYVPEVLVKMRMGGVSNPRFSNVIRVNREAWRAWRVNGMRPAPWTIPLKVFRKLSQFR